MNIRKTAAVIMAALLLIQPAYVSAIEAPTYDGEGMCIAVIDNGFSTEHESFALTHTSPKLTKEASDTLLPSTLAGKAVQPGTSLYVSEKIPFAYDYGDGDADVQNGRYAGDGNVMISVAAGNVKHLVDGSVSGLGAAPEAQVFAMKVYSDTLEGISGDAVADAIFDSVTLGADVILIDIAVIGGLSYEADSERVHAALEKAEENGVIVVCPAGDVLEYGKGSVFEKEYEIVSVPTTAPDRGTVAWPGSASNVLSVASADSNSIESDGFTLADGSRIAYSDNNRVYSITEGKRFAEHFDGQSFEYVYIDGIGTSEEFSEIGDLSGKIAVVNRGTISFSEKAKNAAAVNAVGVVVVDNQYSTVETLKTLTDLTDAPIPLVLVSYTSGKMLAAAADKKISIKNGDTFTTLTRITPNVSKFSAFGTTPDLALKPDVTAVGSSVVYASANGGYDTVSSTIASAARVAGICACVKQKLMSEHPELMGAVLAETVKALVVGSARTMVQTLDSYPYSPRAQGGGVTNTAYALDSDMTLTYGESHKLELGDGVGSFIQFSVTATNLSSQKRNCTLDAVVGSDAYRSYKVDQLELDLESESPLYARLGYNGGETISFINDFTPFKKAGVYVSSAGSQLNAYAEDYSPFSFELSPGEKKTFNVTVYLNRDEFKTYSDVFENGFFIEGFMRMYTGNSVYTAPFLGLAGDFSAAPAIEADVYGDGQAIYESRYIYRYYQNETITLGDVTGPEDEEPVYDVNSLYFSPKADKNNAELMLNFALLRTVTDVNVTVTDGTGRVVSNRHHGTVGRTYLSASTGMTTTEQLSLWNGRADDNFEYVYPDGRYTVTVNYRIPGAYRTESFSYEILVDTTAPEIKNSEFEIGEYTCHLKLDIVDNFEVYSVEVTDSAGNTARQSENGVYNTSLMTGKHIYVDVSDPIGNRRVVRLDNPVYIKSGD